MPSNAFVTLLTTASYLPGALVLLHALHDLHPAPRDFQIIAIVTPETVDAKTIGELRKAGYDLVIGVEPIGSGAPGQAGLHLMGRPDLNLALTKLHLFRLQSLFSTLIYLDADVLPLRPLSHLFTSTAPHPLSACPDTGWPDCFNSGVMVIRPRESDWQGLKDLLKSGEGDQGIYEETGLQGNGSFDGADQGLLNEWFSEEGGGGDWNRLSFTYNVTPSAAYTYAPAYRRYGHKINAVHFIGPNKPWANLQTRPAGMSRPSNQTQSYDYPYLIDRWYEVYDRHVRPHAASAPDQARRFAVPEHVAVWNRENPGQALPSGDDRLDLDKLKAATQMGVTALRSSGQYISLPLDGRVDLLMPKPKPKKVSWSDSTPSASTAPGQPAPPVGTAPPPSQGGQAEPSAISSPSHVNAPLPQSYEQQMQQPKTWDAAHFPPPKHGEPEMKIPMNTFYQPAWEQPNSVQSSYFQQPQHQPQSQYPTLPANVRGDDWYKEFTGSVPDRSNVQAVFPWEKPGQRKADRVFPRGDSPPPQQQPQTTQQRGPIHLSVQEPTPRPSPEIPSPPVTQHRSMAEAMASYKNAWDDDPRIERYVNRLTGGASSSRHHNRHTSRDYSKVDSALLQSVPNTPKRAQREWLDHVPLSAEVSRSDASEDGDDEDDGDDGPDLSGSPSQPTRTPMSMNPPPQFVLPDAPTFYKSNAKYRDRHVQTEKPNLNNAQVQVYPEGPISPVTSMRPLQSMTSTSTSMSGPSSAVRKGKLALSRGSSSSDTPKAAQSQSSTLATPSSTSTSQFPERGGERRGVPFPTDNQPQSFSPAIRDASRTDSSQPVNVSRIFDPSTDVDVRRRDTQQVLSRFMQVGAFARTGGAGEGGRMA